MVDNEQDFNVVYNFAYGMNWNGKTNDDIVNKTAKPHRKKKWCIPAQKNGEFDARMKDILKFYMLP